VLPLQGDHRLQPRRLHVQVRARTYIASSHPPNPFLELPWC
jgi:hypothetical protein